LALNNVSTEESKDGEIWIVDLGEPVGHRQGGIRPLVITSNNTGNHFSPTIQGIPFTDLDHKTNNQQSTHAIFRCGEAGLTKDSVLMAEQECTINKFQLIKRLGIINYNQAVRISIAMANCKPITRLAYEVGAQNTVTFQKLSYHYQKVAASY
jgi:mRNA interferase MazF